MKKLILGIASTLLISIQAITLATAAHAENIPVLIWERGQTHNVIMGTGSTNQNWKLYLVDENNKRFDFISSIRNKDGFYVYSIDLEQNFGLGGYLIEAVSINGDTKQVAGIQVIKSSIKSITRIPNELLIVLFGFSFFLFVLNQVRFRGIQLKSLTEPSLHKAAQENLITRKLRFWFNHHAKESLIKNIILDEIRIENHFSYLLSPFGFLATVFLIIAQLQSGDWVQSSAILITLVLILGNVTTTFGLLASSISLVFSLLNISIVRSMSEMLSLILLSVIIIGPNLYNQFLFKLFNTVETDKQIAKKFISKAIPALVAAFSSYQLMITFESLNPNFDLVVLPKENISLLLLCIFTLKNFVMHRFIDENSHFDVIRAIGPIASYILSCFVGLICYIWTTNLMISAISFIAISMILTLNWLKFRVSLPMSVPQLPLGFGLAILAVLIFSLFTIIRYLPLDVLNRSNLLILLTFPIDLFFAIYMTLSSNIEVRRVGI